MTIRDNGGTKNLGYLRVSTVDQHTERQLDGLTLDRVFTDKASGKTIERPALAECLAFLRTRDTLHVHSIDRLARNLQDLLHLLTDLSDAGVTVRFHKEGLTFAPADSTEGQSPFQRLQLQIIGAVAEFERSMIRERQREGIAIAKAEGRYKGRKPSLTPEQVTTIRERMNAGEKVAHLAREFGVSRQTVYEHMNQQSPTTVS